MKKTLILLFFISTMSFATETPTQNKIAVGAVIANQGLVIASGGTAMTSGLSAFTPLTGAATGGFVIGTLLVNADRVYLDEKVREKLGDGIWYVAQGGMKNDAIELIKKLKINETKLLAIDDSSRGKDKEKSNQQKIVFLSTTSVSK